MDGSHTIKKLGANVMNLVVGLAVVGLCGLAICSAKADLSPNLVKNPSFAEGETGWGFQKPYYGVASDVGRTDSFSMHYDGKLGTPYVLCTHWIDTSGGKSFVYGAWVKTKNVRGMVKICLEWGNKNGYSGGNYIDTGISGTTDWQRVMFASPKTPDDITGVNLVLYAEGGTRGDIWFDDAEVREVTKPLVEIEYPEPVWHGSTILASDECPEIRLKLKSSEEDITVRAKLAERSDHQPWVSVEVGEWKDGIAEIAIPTQDLPLGINSLTVDVVDVEAKRPIFRENLEITKLEMVSLDIIEPNTMGVVGRTADEKPELKCRMQVRLPRDVPAREYDAALSLITIEGNVIRQNKDITVQSGKPQTVKFSLLGIPEGTYYLQATISDSGKTERLAASRRLVSVLNPKERPVGAVDSLPNGLVRVDGKEFLPIGIYMHSSWVPTSTEEYHMITGNANPDYYEHAIDMIARSPLNCVLDYAGNWRDPCTNYEALKGFMDYAASKGVRVIYSVKDFVLKAIHEGNATLDNKNMLGEGLHIFKEHPATLAVYVNDETFGPKDWHAYKDAAVLARQIDPWHPSYHVHYNYFGSLEYAKACDAYGTDPYTIMGDIGQMAKSWRTAKEAMPEGQPMWAVVQAFGSGYETGNLADMREPTYDEMRCGTFTALAEGATGIIYYALSAMQKSPKFSQRWRELCSIADEVNKLTPIVAMPLAKRPVKAVKGSISIRTKQSSDGLYVILTNTDRKEQDIELQWPAEVVSVMDYFSAKPLSIDTGMIKIKLPPLAANVLVGKLK